MNESNFFAKNQPWFTFIYRLVLGGVIFAAGALKVSKPEQSAMAVRAYELLPIGLANVLGYSLPWIEMAIGIFLIIGIAVKPSAIAGGILMAVFIGAISQAWARGLNIDCGCFGGGGTIAAKDTKYLEEIIRDFGLVLAAVFLTIFPDGKLGLDSRSSKDDL